MAAPGLGIDLIEIERLERALERHPRLAGRLFTDGELAYAGERRRPGTHLAARFAAKEAAIKALGLRHGIPREVEVVGGKPPRLLLSGATASAAEAEGIELRISLTHSRTIAAAVVLSVSR